MNHEICGTNAVTLDLSFTDIVISSSNSYTHLKCSHKVYSKSTCVLCWHCPKCGKTGCDNAYYLKPEDTLNIIACEFDGKE